jgi:hypothetical protein
MGLGSNVGIFRGGGGVRKRPPLKVYITLKHPAAHLFKGGGGRGVNGN